jgi:hypothetical protein
MRRGLERMMSERTRHVYQAPCSLEHPSYLTGWSLEARL